MSDPSRRIGLVGPSTRPVVKAIVEQFERLVAGRAELVRPPAGGDGTDLADIEVDVVVAVGGDGTFLRAVREARAPVLPINAGTVGVLAEVDGRDPGALGRAVERLLTGAYRIEDRMALSVEVPGRGVLVAANDLLFHAGRPGRMATFRLGLSDLEVGSLRADGLLVATPTGSTGYALSLGGPILDGAVDALLLVPLAPFRTPARTLILDPLVELRLSADPGGDLSPLAILDGQPPVPVPAGAELRAYRSPRRSRWIRFDGRLFRRLEGKGIAPWEPLSAPPRSPGPPP